jgi:hypothetical protein
MVIKLTPRDGKWNGIECKPTHVEVESFDVTRLPLGWFITYTDIEANTFTYAIDWFDSVEVIV